MGRKALERLYKRQEEEAKRDREESKGETMLANVLGWGSAVLIILFLVSVFAIIFFWVIG